MILNSLYGDPNDKKEPQAALQVPDISTVIDTLPCTVRADAGGSVQHLISIVCCSL